MAKNTRMHHTVSLLSSLLYKSATVGVLASSPFVLSLSCACSYALLVCSNGHSCRLPRGAYHVPDSKTACYSALSVPQLRVFLPRLLLALRRQQHSCMPSPPLRYTALLQALPASKRLWHKHGQQRVVTVALHRVPCLPTRAQHAQQHLPPRTAPSHRIDLVAVQPLSCVTEA